VTFLPAKPKGWAEADCCVPRYSILFVCFICVLSLEGETHGAQNQGKDLELGVNHLTQCVYARVRKRDSARARARAKMREIYQNSYLVITSHLASPSTKTKQSSAELRSPPFSHTLLLLHLPSLTLCTNMSFRHTLLPLISLFFNRSFLLFASVHPIFMPTSPFLSQSLPLDTFPNPAFPPPPHPPPPPSPSASQGLRPGHSLEVTVTPTVS
jgi:hypothetical protein